MSLDEESAEEIDSGESWKEKPPEGAELSTVEALLFVSPEPLSAEAISEITGIDMVEVFGLLEELKDSYEARAGGLVIREVAGGFGIYAVPDAAPFIARLIKTQVNPRLTKAALETLAITAYMQPVPRSVIAEIRGVQSEGVMKTLEDRGLVKPMGKGGPPGYPVLYGTTGRFLERFGLKSVEDLPPLERFAPDEDTIGKIERSLSWEMLEEESGARRAESRKNTQDPGEFGSGLTESFGGTTPEGQGDPERGEGEAG